MEKKIKTIEELKELMGLDKIYPEINGREKLEKMIDPNKYYLVICHSIPFKGSTILKRNFQPILILQDLGYSLTAEQWQYYRELQRKGEYITERKEIQKQ
jgi:hypothetical protein